MTAVSVLMTAFNAGEYLQVAVKSLVGQTHLDWELILVDNGSTDLSVEALNLSDQRIRVIRLEENIGRTPALKLALECAQNPYVAILDADDVCYPDRLEVQATFLDNNRQYVLVGSCVDVINSRGQITGELCVMQGKVSHDALAERNIFVNSSLMYRREEALAHGGYDNRFEYAQDFHLTLKLATSGETFNHPSHLVQLRVLETSYTRVSSTKLIRARDEAELFQLASATLKLTGEGMKASRYRRAITQLHLGYCLVRRRKMLEGFRTILAGLRTDKKLGWIIYLARARRDRRALMPSG